MSDRAGMAGGSSTASGPPYVQVEGLRLILGDAEVLRRVHLTVRLGELVAVTGPSGSGKTSLLTVLAGFRLPDAGRVVIGDLDVSTLDEAGVARLRRETLALLSQDFQLLPELDAQRNVAMPLLLAGVAPREALERAGRALQDVGLDGHRRLRAGVLSRGQQQRVALARALIHPKPLLLLDEPTSSLDRAARDVAVAQVRRAADRGAAVLFTTHDPDVAAIADRRLLLQDGRIVEELRAGGEAP